MVKNLRKTLAFLLALSMLTGMLGTAAFAAEEGETAPETQVESVLPADEGNGNTEETPAEEVTETPAAVEEPAEAVESTEEPEADEAENGEPVGDGEPVVDEDIAPIAEDEEETVLPAGASETALETGVSITGIAGLNGLYFDTMENAYNAVKNILQKMDATQGGEALNQGQLQPDYDDKWQVVKTAQEKFDEVYTQKTGLPGHSGAKLTWTVFGRVEVPSTLDGLFLSGGRQAAYYGSDSMTIREIEVVGGNETAELVLSKSIKMPYQWWGPSTDGHTFFSARNVGLTLNNENMFFIDAVNMAEFDCSVINCSIKGKLYHYFNGPSTLTVENCSFVPNNNETYAFMAQGHATEPLTVNFKNNTVSGYVRGINIDQVTADVTVTGNTIIPGTGYSAVQISGCAAANISGNTIHCNGGNVLTLHEKLATNKVDGRTITLQGNTVDGEGYLIYDDVAASNKGNANACVNLAMAGNSLADTIVTDKGIKGSTEYDTKVQLVAEVNGVQYSSLQGAIDAAQSGETVVMLKDTVENIQVSNQVVLDLNGKTLTNADEGSIGNEAMTIWVQAGGVLEVVGKGTVKITKAAGAAVFNQGTVTLSGGTYERPEGTQGYVLFNSVGAEMTLNEGITASSADPKSSLAAFDAGKNGPRSTVTINGGTYTSINTTLKNDANTDLVINGGTFTTSTHYALVNYDKATVNGGEFHGRIWNSTGIAGVGELKVEGGSFDVAEDKDVIFVNNGEGTIAVSGGTFSRDVSGYCVPGTKWDETTHGIVADIQEGTVATVGTVAYDSLAEAIAACPAGGTVKVVGDVELAGSINPGKEITIEGVTKSDGTKPVIRGSKGLFSFTKANGTLKNLNLQATGNTWYIYHSAGEQTGTVTLTVTGCEFTMADGVSQVGNLIMTEGTKTKTPVIFVGNTVFAHSRVALAGPGDNSVITGNTIDLIDESYDASRTSVIGLTTTADNVNVVITDNVFKNANRVLGVDNAVLTNDKLTFKNNAFIDCRWAFEFNPNTQEGFDLAENYYVFNNVVGAAKIEDASKSGSHKDGTTAYTPAEGEEKAVVTSYYTERDSVTGALSNLAVGPDAVAQVGEQYYSSLQAAIDAAKNGETVVMLKNVEENIVVAKGKVITLDLNGCKLNGTCVNGSKNDPSVLTNNGTLTIRDTSKDQKGEITRDEMDQQDHKRHRYIIENKGTMTIEGGYIHSQCVREGNPPSAVVNVGTSENDIAYMTIIGGKLSHADGITLKNDDYADLTVTGGEIEGTQKTHGEDERVWAGIQNWSKANIIGGTVSGPLAIEGKTYGNFSSSLTIGGTVVVTGQIQATKHNGATVNSPEIVITGGTFHNGTKGSILSLGANEDLVGSIKVFAGIFDEDVSDYCAEGFLPVANANGTYGVTDEKLTITSNRSSQSGSGTVTLTVAPADLTVEVEVTCDVEGIVVNRGANGTFTAALPNTTATYTFTATAGDQEATCTVSVSQYVAPSVPVTSPEENLGDNDTPLVERPFLFDDVLERDWFYSDVKTMFNKGLILGVTADSFAPYAPSTRAMVATLLYRMAGSPDVAGLEQAFEDVPEKCWYRDAAVWALNNGVFGGYGDGTFRGTQVITREELAAVLNRYAEARGIEIDAAAELDIFTDAEEVSAWAVENMKWAVSAGLINGRDDRLAARESANRAELATLLVRFDKLLSADAEEAE